MAKRNAPVNLKKPKFLISPDLDDKKLIDIGFEPGDVIKVLKILNLEFRLTLSPKQAKYQIDNSFKEGIQSELKRQQKQLYPINIDNAIIEQGVLINQIKSPAGQIKACKLLLNVREEIYSKKYLMIGWAAMDYGNCYKIAESIEQLNPLRNHLEQQISFSAKEFHAPETRTVAHALFLVKNLIAIGDINFKIRDKTLAVEFFKKAWIIGNEYLIAKIENNLLSGVIDITMKELENALKKTSPETLLKKQLSCSLITSRGVDKEEADKTVAMKLIMHDYIIEPCIKRTEANNWSGGFGKKWGLCTYVEPTYIKKILSNKKYKDPTGTYGIKEVTEADILTAQMLCFREICLAEHTSQKADLTCLTQFIAKYPNVVKTTLKLHPEYCIDSKIVLATKGILALHTSVADIPLITSIEISLNEQVELGGNAEEFKE